MVVLSRIYTKTGDRGITALGNGRKVAKDHRRVEAYGTVDELNAALGLALTTGLEPDATALLVRIQNDLFDLGADLSFPGQPRRRRGPSQRTKTVRLKRAYVQPLEAAIDRLNAPLPKLRRFVVPGGTPASAWLHLARTVCRRAERKVVALSRREPVNPDVIVYLNRLSDLLFVLARRAHGHVPDEA